MSKGQASIEFLAYVSLSMLMLAVFYGVIAQKQSLTINSKIDQEAKRVGEKFSFEVEMALVQGEGYSRVFSVPTQISGYNYTITLEDGYALVEWANKSRSLDSRYPGESIEVDVSPGNNVFEVKNNGTLVVESE